MLHLVIVPEDFLEGMQHQMIGAAGRGLGEGIEEANFFHGVPVEYHANRPVLTEGMNVENFASEGELTGYTHPGHPAETVFDELLFDFHGVNLSPCFQPQKRSRRTFRTGNAAQCGPQRGYHHPALPGGQFGQNTGPPPENRGLGGYPPVEHGTPPGEMGHFGDEELKIPNHGAGLGLIGNHNENRTAPKGGQAGDKGGGPGPSGTRGPNGEAALAPVGVQGFPVGEAVHRVIEG